MSTHDREEVLRVPAVEPQMVTGANGVGLATYEWGKPDGKAILLIHGVAQCHLCFAPQIVSDLAREFRLVAYDVRGHGASDKPLDAKAYQHESAWADDLAAVLKAKALERPVVAGWSMGGRILRQYLMRYGDQALGGINFVGSRVIEEPGAVGPATPKARPHEPSTLTQQIEEAIGFLDACYHQKPAPWLYERALCYNMLVPLLVRRACSGWSTDPAATRSALQKVRVPTLITQGTRDAIVSPEGARMIAQAIPHARISWFEDCGHSPFQEDADRFNQELAAFAREVHG
jgi:pimeloyl-ACP methyl ester carboxylesterase